MSVQLTQRQGELLALLSVPIKAPPLFVRGKERPHDPRSVYRAASSHQWFIEYGSDLPHYNPFLTDEVLPLFRAGLLTETFPGQNGYFHLADDE